MSFNLRERQVIRLLQDEYEPKGYSFIAYPPSTVLPEWIGNYSPDALALKDGDNIVFEIIDRRDKNAPLAPVSERFKGKQGWSFIIVYTPSGSDSDAFKALRRDEIETRLLEVEALVEGGHYEAAMLLSWAALEATARIYSEKRELPADKAFSSRQLVEFLASYGCISQDEGEELRMLASKRNNVAHGYGEKVGPRDIDRVVRLVVRLVQGEDSGLPQSLGEHRGR